MTEQELADEVCILDKACRQCGTELAGGGIAALGAHEVAVKALVAKLKRLEAATAASMEQNNPQGDTPPMPPQ